MGLDHYDRMREISLTVPEIGLMAGTRVALGVGIGLLLSNRLNKDERKAAGLALMGVGILTTVPIIISVIGKRRGAEKPVVLVA
jgi:hypothetical protein